MLPTFIKLPFVIKIFVLSIFEWPFYTGFTVFNSLHAGKLFIIFCSLLTFFEKIISGISLEYRHSVSSYLGLNCLRMLLAEDTSK